MCVQIDIRGLQPTIEDKEFTIVGQESAGHNMLAYTSSYEEYYILADVFDSEVWKPLRDLQDPQLRRLATKLPGVILSGKADSTTRKYLYAYEKWRRWAESQSEVTALPAKPMYVALYLQHILELAKSKAPVDDAVNTIAWAHRMAGLPSPTDNHLVQAFVAGAHRLVAKPVTRKEPVTVETLEKLVQKLAAPSATLTDIRTVSICVLGFSAFLRFDELSQLRACDLEFGEELLKITIRSSKTDQLRQGNQVMVSRSGKPTCPVAILERYLQMAGEPMSSDKPLFRGITKTKKGEKLRNSGGLSYTRTRELVLGQFKELGMDTKRLGLHSLRAGGATAAANAGIQDRLFKRHGRWRSETAKDGYIRESQEDLLSVSRSLGI